MGDASQSSALRRDYLNAKRYSSLKYAVQYDPPSACPRTSLVSGRSESRAALPLRPTCRPKNVHDAPRGSRGRRRPVVEAAQLRRHGHRELRPKFVGGRAVSVSAERGQAVLRQRVDTDPGAARLGELALVPHSSPVAQSGLLFYNTLFDENAASHVALGSAYKFTMSGGEHMDDDAFERAGGNRSAVHVDFMIGSPELDVDGLLPNGTSEPLMRRGEWAVEFNNCRYFR